jgi:hypothetical protein
MTATMMFRSTRLLSAATLTLAAMALPLSAQEGTTNSPNCDRAARGVLEKPLPAPGTEGWNSFMELTSCGSRGATVVAGVIQSPMVRAEMDPARLDALTGMLDGWFSPALVNAYESVVASPQSSPGMRLRAMWLLSGLLAPNTEVAGPLQGYTASTCGSYDRVTALRNAPNALPQQAYDDARLALARAASDPTAPDAVRSTARCWSDAVIGRGNAGTSYGSTVQTVSDDRENAPTTVVNQTTVINNGPPPITVVEPIEVRYECDGRFVILNQSPALMSLRYEVEGAGWGGMLQVGGRASHVFVAARVGPLRFYVGSREVAYVRYTRRSCFDWHDRYTVVVASRMYYPPPVYLSQRPAVVVRPRGGVVVVGGRDGGRDGGRERDNGRDRDRVTPVNPRGGSDGPARNGNGSGNGNGNGNGGGASGGSQGGRTAVPRGNHTETVVPTTMAAPSMNAPRAPDHMRRPAESAPQGSQPSRSQPQGEKGSDKKDESRQGNRRP